MEFNYPLDTYQKNTIRHINEGSSVFVSVPTGAGKTTVAEYCIHKCLTEGANVVYTAPIKALCNQKYHDFKNQFGNIDVPETFGGDCDGGGDNLWYDSFYDNNNTHNNRSMVNDKTPNVGVVTGDIQVNDEAQCLVMTTEILRNMIYKNSGYLDNVDYIIFDEIHYISDESRGHVWEEVITKCPRHIAFIFLSATSPNRVEFCDWVSKTRPEKKVYIEYSDKRPVPLNMYLYYGEPESNTDFDPKKNLLCMRKGETVLNVDRKLFSLKHSSGSTGKGSFDNKNFWLNFVKMLMRGDCLPAVVFAFARRKTQKYMQYLESINLTTTSEKSHIKSFINKTFEKIHVRQEHLELPQIRLLMDFIERGIAFHHSGLIPFMKEIIEVLLKRGYIKLLFATETFSMGLNMPTRTVVFTQLSKFDGKENRTLLSGEYIQMAGRAGRRGMDSVGHVINLQTPNFLELRHLVKGEATKMQSRFELTYQTILHFLIKNEELQFSSFRDYTLNSKNYESKDKIMRRIKSIQTELKNENKRIINSQLQSQQAVNEKLQIVMKIIDSVSSSNNFLFEKFRFGVGTKILVCPDLSDTVSLYPVKSTITSMGPEGMKCDDEYYIDPIWIWGIYDKENDHKTLISKWPGMTLDQFEAYKTILENITELAIDTMEIIKYTPDELACAKKNMDLEGEMLSLNQTLKDHYNLDFLEYEQKQLVLRELGMVSASSNNNNSNVVGLSGKIAYQINTAHCLATSMAIVQNVFDTTETEELIALLGSFVAQGSKNPDEIKEGIIFPKENTHIRTILNTIFHAELKHKVCSRETNELLHGWDETTQEILYDWMRCEASLADLVRKFEIEEGTFFRLVFRLDEFIQELLDVCDVHISRDSPLHKKLIDGQKILVRDILRVRSIFTLD